MTNKIDLAKNFSVNLDSQDIPQSYQDGRPYRYGLNPTMNDCVSYPFAFLSKDVVLRTVHQYIQDRTHLTPDKKESLSMRIRSTNMNFKLLEMILQSQSSLSPEQRQEIDKGIQEFNELMNKPFE